MIRALPVLALTGALLVAGPAQADELLPAGDVDGDGRSDILWRGATHLSLWSGAALAGPPRWAVVIDPDAVV